MKHVSLISFVVLLFSPLVWGAPSPPSEFEDTAFVSGLSQPTAMKFSPDGRLFICQQRGQLRVVENGNIGVGDNAVRSNSQTLSNRLGKILRINADGSIPSDNPFVGQAGSRGEIWALGFRNPFTFDVPSICDFSR